MLDELKRGSFDEPVKVCQAELMQVRRINMKLQRQFSKSNEWPSTYDVDLKAQISRFQMQNAEVQN